jgi:hypothetical protein
MAKTFTVPDARQLVIEGLDDLDVRWASVVQVSSPQGQSRFYTAAAGANVLAEQNAGSLNEKHLRVVTTGAVTLTSIEDPESRTTMFIRGSDHHELYTTQAGTDIPMDEFEKVLARLDLADSPAGLVVRGAQRSTCRHLLSVSAPIGLDCSLTIRPRGAPGTEKINGKGRMVRGGELWSLRGQEGDGENVRHVAVINDSAHVTFSFVGAPTAALGSIVEQSRFTIR